MKRRTDLDAGPWNGNPGGVMTVGAPRHINLEARSRMKLAQNKVNGVVAKEKRKLEEQHALATDKTQSKAFNDGFTIGFKAGLAVGLCFAVCAVMLVLSIYFKWWSK